MAVIMGKCNLCLCVWMLGKFWKMFVSRDNFSTIYIYKQHVSSTTFDILFTLKPANRFNIITKHSCIQYMKCSVRAIKKWLLTKYCCICHGWLWHGQAHRSRCSGNWKIQMQNCKNFCYYLAFCKCIAERSIIQLHLSIGVSGKKLRSHNLIHFPFALGTHLLLCITYINPIPDV